MVQEMYSHDYRGLQNTLQATKVHFYVNDGVWLCKYFVSNQDPQGFYVWAILAINFLCVMFISVSYIMIGFISQKFSKRLTQSGGNQQISQRNQKMDKNISIIITTDFFCWIPTFIVVSGSEQDPLHSGLSCTLLKYWMLHPGIIYFIIHLQLCDKSVICVIYFGTY